MAESLNQYLKLYFQTTMAKVYQSVRASQSIDSDGKKMVNSTDLIKTSLQKLFHIATLEGLRIEPFVDLDDLSVAWLKKYMRYILSEEDDNSPEMLCSLIISEAYDYLVRWDEFMRIFDISWSAKDYETTFSSLLIVSFLGLSAQTFKFEINNHFCELISEQKPARGMIGCRSIIPRVLRVMLKQDIAHFRKGKNVRKLLTRNYTLFQGLKKGLLPIRPDAVDASLLKHKSALTKLILNPMLNESGKQSDFAKFCKKRLSSKYNRLTVPNKEFRPKIGSLSIKSTCESSVKQGGQVGLAQSFFDCNKDEEFLTSLILNGRVVDTSCIIRVPYFCGYREERKIMGGESVAEFSKTSLFNGGILLPYFSFGALDRELVELLLFLRKFKYIDSGVVQPCVILEPLKGRIITRPSTGEYLMLTEIQQFLWKRLKTFREFELVGRPIQIEDVWFISNNWKQGDVFVSGDFDGATDNLNSHLSEFILRWLLRKFDQGRIDEIILPFLHSRIDYTRNPLGGDDSSWTRLCSEMSSMNLGIVEQTNGQLMGHVLSFIVLCLANKLVYDWSFDRRGKRSPRVLINGDDILFKCRRADVPFWNDTCTEMGLFPSIGKNLVQEDICQINSELFRIEFDNVDDTFVSLDGFSLLERNYLPFVQRRYIRNIFQVPFVNFGILTGRGKGKSDLHTGRQSMSQIMEESEKLSEFLPVLWTYIRRNTRVSTQIDPKVILEIHLENNENFRNFWEDYMWDFPEYFFLHYFKKTTLDERELQDLRPINTTSYNLFQISQSVDVTPNLLNFVRTVKKNHLMDILPHGLTQFSFGPKIEKVYHLV
jgi:hypothetical protein